MAGPGGPVEVDGAVLGGVFDALADRAVIAEGLRVAGHADVRRRWLTGVFTVIAVLGLCLFRRENYDLVLGRVLAGVPRVLVEGRPTAVALSKARARLAEGVMPAVFTGMAARMPSPGVECFVFGLLVTAFDGTVFDLADTAAVRQAFATPSGGRFPQARMVSLVVCGNRWIAAAAVGSSSTSEQALVDTMSGALRPGTVNLCDRNFFSMARWVRFSATGAHLVWRVKNGAVSLPARLVRVLCDGSALVRLRESDAMLARRRAKAGDPRLPRLACVLARLVEFTLRVRDSSGRIRTTRFRVLTTLLDPVAYPARQIAELYAERWQIELVYARVKTTLRGTGSRLRGQSPHLAVQEIWGLLIVYNALAAVAVAAAVKLDVDPDEISFAAVLALTRASVVPDRACPRCGCRPSELHDPIEDLITAVTTQVRNRTGRQRTAPRTKKQRETERTRNVTYEINIVVPNLPTERETP